MDSNKQVIAGEPLDILKDHLYWLRLNGFTEKGLHFPGKKGWLADNIAEKYLQAVEAIKVHPVPQEFSQAITGFFNNEDLVHYVFRYQVEPEKFALELSGMTARLGENRKTILINTPLDLVRADEIYSLLASEKQLNRSTEPEMKEIFKMSL